MFWAKVSENPKTRILLPVTLFSENPYPLLIWGERKQNALLTFPLQQWLRERATVLTLYVHYISCCVLGPDIFLSAPAPVRTKVQAVRFILSPSMYIYHLEGFHQSTHPVIAAVPRDIMKGTTVLHITSIHSMILFLNLWTPNVKYS
jgi:hypothetical protein